MDCLTDNDVAALLAGQLDDAAYDRVLGHIDECSACRTLAADATNEDGAEPLLPGSHLGRYVILELLGAGAMGVVYAAHDPSLDRKVAIKLLRADAGEDREVMASRLLREARVLARLAHPNVVVLHDVGRRDDEVFLAMELVEGSTLRRWLAQPGHTWRDVLRMFLQAGEGLAIAHEHEIVHRDFKPDNVLVGRDGRARVTDFGLARGVVEHAATDASAPTSRELVRSLATRSSLLAGTPAYMAPEQLAGKQATPLSDQYAFSVALHEALWGARPGAAPTAGRDTRRDAGPSALKKVLQRGLQARPEARWPDMRAMLRELARIERLGSPWRWVAVAAATVMAGSVGFALVRDGRAARPCTSPFDASTEGWDQEAQRRLAQAFHAAGPDGDRVFDALRRRLDRRATDVGQLRRDACQAFRVRQEITSTQFDQRQMCLNRRRGELASLVQLLSQGDKAVMGNALPLESSLPDVAACQRWDALSRRPPLPADPAQRAVIQQLDERLTEAETWALASVRHAESDEVGHEVLTRSASLGWRLLETRARLMLAKTQVARGTTVKADRLATEAAAAALVAHDDEVLADAWLTKIDVAGSLGHLDDAEDHGKLAEAAIQRLGGDPVREAGRLANLCRAHERVGKDLTHAQLLCERARDLLVRDRPNETLRIAAVEERLGNVLLKEEKFAESEVLYRSVIEKRRAALPDDSDSIVNVRGNLAEALTLQKKYAEALPLFEEAVRARSWWHLSDGLALVHWKMGDHPRALAAQRRSLDACLKESPGSLCEALTLIRLGEFQLDAKLRDDARQSLERALALKEKSVDVPPLDDARAHLLLATMATSASEAASHRQKAKALLEPVAHRGGSHKELLDAANAPALSVPSL